MKNFWGHFCDLQAVAELLVIRTRAEYAKDDLIQVWSESKKQWFDGVVDEAFEIDTTYGAYPVQAGMVKVTFVKDGQTSCRYVAPHDVSKFLRDRPGRPRASSSRSATSAPLPQSLVAELGRDDTLKLSEELRRYLGVGFGKTLIGRILGQLEAPLRSLLGSLGEDASSPTPLVINIQVAAMWIDTGPMWVWIPTLELALFLDLRLEPGVPYVWRCRVAMPDTYLTHLLDVLRKQIVDVDLRTLTDSLSGFTDPVKLEFKLDHSWSAPDASGAAASSSFAPTASRSGKESRLRLEVKNFSCRLGLPR